MARIKKYGKNADSPVKRKYGENCVIYQSDMKPVAGYVPPASVVLASRKDISVAAKHGEESGSGKRGTKGE